MKYGICNLSIIPLRFEPSDASEMVSQVLYGHPFKVLEHRSKWSRIRLDFDRYEGWIDNKQYFELTESDYLEVSGRKPKFSGDLVNFITTQEGQLLTIPIGSSLTGLSFLKHTFEGSVVSGTHAKINIVETALTFLNCPYLWGGKSPFGIDCSGLTQLVYQLNGFKLLRDAKDQATQGEALSFIEESEPGDLAFFDNSEGNIIHVGIIMADHRIIHAHGKVRIDHLDHTGIFNTDTRKHSHKLRVIKKIV